MALIVEDGTIVAGAQSYLSVADCDSYHAGANAAWAALDTSAKEGALIRATRSLDRRYTWKGYQVERGTQRLEWPRVAVYVDNARTFNSLIRDYYEYPSNEIPQAVKDACAEFALREGTSAGSTLPDIDHSTRVKRKSSKAGPVETETEYLDSSDLTVAFQTVDFLLESAGLISPAGVVELERA